MFSIYIYTIISILYIMGEKSKARQSPPTPIGYYNIAVISLLILTFISSISTLYINYNVFMYTRNVLSAFEKSGNFLKKIIPPTT